MNKQAFIDAQSLLLTSIYEYRELSTVVNWRETMEWAIIRGCYRFIEDTTQTYGMYMFGEPPKHMVVLLTAPGCCMFCVFHTCDEYVYSTVTLP